MIQISVRNAYKNIYKASSICVILELYIQKCRLLGLPYVFRIWKLILSFLLIKLNPFLESLEDINLSWKKGIDFSVWNGHLKYRLECYRIRLNKGFMSSHQDAQRRNLFNIVVALNFWMDKPNTVGRRSTYLLSVFDIPSIKNLQA